MAYEDAIKKTARWAKENGFRPEQWWNGRENGKCIRGRKKGARMGEDFGGAGETLKQDATKVVERAGVRVRLAEAESDDARKEVEALKGVEGELQELKRKYDSLKSDHRNLKGFVKVYEGGCKAKFQRVSDAHADLREQHNLPSKEFAEPSPFKESFQRYKDQDSDSDDCH